MKNRTIRKFFSKINYQNLFFTILGSAITAFGAIIHVHSNTADGGLLGLARLIEYYTGGNISLSLATLILNILCYIVAWRLMDTQFVFNMAMGTLTYTFFTYIFENYMSLHLDYVLLATVLGMLCMEVGTGLMLRYGSAPNGEHVLSMAISKRGDIDFGWFNFIKDFIIILLFIPVLNDFSAIIYSLIIMTICVPVLDYIVTAPKRSSIQKSVKKKKNVWLAILIVGLVISIAFAIASVYVNDYYRADDAAVKNLSYETVESEELENGFTAFVPKGEIKAGFVFYPGGKVEYSAYAPLLQACADRGILCIAVEMPLNLAVFGINKAMKAIELYPEVDNWYIGGHSLGGSMAASCAAAHEDEFDGVILLGAYSTADVTSFPVLSVYGSCDGVMNREKYEKYKKNLPSDFEEYVIDGGNHAYFGMYGEQSGDGKATITNSEQISLTVSRIVEFILE